ncbi:unnamed protein product [Prunus armeniaca]
MGEKSYLIHHEWFPTEIVEIVAGIRGFQPGSWVWCDQDVESVRIGPVSRCVMDGGGGGDLEQSRLLQSEGGS